MKIYQKYKPSMQKYIPLFFLLFSRCVSPEDKCHYFCNGDKWHYEDYKIATYPTVYPLKKDEVIISIEEGLKDWQVIGNDRIIVTGKNNSKKMIFTFEIHADTLILKAENNYLSKLMIRELSATTVACPLTGHLPL